MSIFSGNFAQRTLYKGKWLYFRQLTFTSAAGKQCTWEYITRPERFNSLDGVKILATIQEHKIQKLITIAMYRHAIDRYVLELPAGGIDQNDRSCAEAALRELREESGFVARHNAITRIGPVTYNDPWKSNECSRTVCLEVDAELPENREPKQELDTEEFAEVHLLPLSDLLGNLMELASECDYQIDSSLYYFAMGLKLRSDSLN